MREYELAFQDHYTLVGLCGLYLISLLAESNQCQNKRKTPRKMI